MKVCKVSTYRRMTMKASIWCRLRDLHTKETFCDADYAELARLNKMTENEEEHPEWYRGSCLCKACKAC